MRVGKNGVTDGDIAEWLNSGFVEPATIDRTLRVPVVSEEVPLAPPPPQGGIIAPEDPNPLEPSQPNAVDLPPIPEGMAYGKWPHAPDSMDALSLTELNAMVLAIDPTVPPFSTVEEARAQLSSDFKPME